MPPLESLVFTAFCIATAAIIWHARLAPARPSWIDGLGIFLPVGVLFFVVGVAALDGRGTRLSAALTQMRIPQTALVEDAAAREVFRVGDQADHADLVVRPYLDWRLNRVSMTEEPRTTLRLFARRSAATPERIEASLAPQDYPASVEQDLPGMKISGFEALPLDPATGRRRLDPGQSVRLTVSRDDRHEDPGSKPVDRRTFTLVNMLGSAKTPAALVITPASALTTSAGDCRRSRTTLQAAASEEASRMSYLDPQDLVFDDLGAGGYDGALLASTIGGSIFGQAAPCARANQERGWPVSGDYAGAFTFRFAYLTIPWMLPLLMLSSALACWFFGREALARSRKERIIMPLVFAFLAIRVMVSMGAAVADARVEPQVFFRDAALSLILMPPAMAALLRPASLSRRTDWLMMLAILAGQWLMIDRWLPGETGLDQIVLAGLALALIAGRALTAGSDQGTRPRRSQPARMALRLSAGMGDLGMALARTARPLGRSIAKASVQLWHVLPGFLRRGLSWCWNFGLFCTEPYRRSPLLRIGLFLLLFAGMSRLALRALFHAKERVFGIPLSPPYLATLILGTACLIIGLTLLKETRKRAALPIAGMLIVAIPLAMYLVSDSGFAFVHLPPLCIVGLLACLAAWKPGSNGRIWASVIAFAAPVVLVAGYILGTGLMTAFVNLSDRPMPLAEQMARTINISPNDARLVQLLVPSRVERIGTAAGFEQMEQTAMLHSLNGSLMGEGFLLPVKLLSIRKEQTWDYVTSVHLMRPFGRVGAVAVILVLFAFACAITAQGPPLPGKHLLRRSIGAVSARLAAWTFFTVGTYMVLANLLFLPFTGRSVYLISTLSTGDLIESAMLLALAALAVQAEEG